MHGRNPHLHAQLPGLCTRLHIRTRDDAIFLCLHWKGKWEIHCVGAVFRVPSHAFEYHCAGLGPWADGAREATRLAGALCTRAQRGRACFGIEWFATAQELLDGEKLKPHPLRLVHGGLGGVFHGLEQLRLKRISGQKLVCHVQSSSLLDTDRVLAEEVTHSGEKRYLVSYVGPDTGSSK